MFAKTFNRSVRTIQAWEGKGAPFHDMRKMDEWIADQLRRRGVSKGTPTIADDAQITVVEAEPVSTVIDSPATNTVDSTLARLEVAERLAYSRYQGTAIG